MINLIKSLFKKQNQELVGQIPCPHNWQLVAKTYATPAAQPGATSANYGVTTLLWSCTSCGEFHKEELVGTDENRWLQIVENVDKHGMQYVKENGKVYGVAIWLPDIPLPKKE